MLSLGLILGVTAAFTGYAPPPNCTEAREVFCDLRSGGWTLIGQVGGVDDNIYDKWLVTTHNTAKLRTPVIEARTYGCIDTVDLAVSYVHEVSRFSQQNDSVG